MNYGQHPTESVLLTTNLEKSAVRVKGLHKCTVNKLIYDIHIQNTLIKQFGWVPLKFSLLQQFLPQTGRFACNIPSCSPTDFPLTVISPLSLNQVILYMTWVWNLPLQACDWHEEQEMENFSTIQQQSVAPIQTNPQEYFFDYSPMHASAPIHSLSDVVVQLQYLNFWDIGTHNSYLDTSKSNLYCLWRVPHTVLACLLEITPFQSYVWDHMAWMTRVKNTIHTLITWAWELWESWSVRIMK